MARLGLSRTVIVQPSAYGTDNRCTLAAMATLSDAARGVAILPEDVSDAEITRLNGLGMRGLRCLMDIPAGMMDWDRTRRMAPRFVERDGISCQQFAAAISRSRAGAEGAARQFHHRPFGSVRRGALDPDGPAIAGLRWLLDTGRVWVKLSAPYHADRAGPPRYNDVMDLARRLAEHTPERRLGQQLAASRAHATAG